MTVMTSRQRVIATLNHQEPDRVPFDCPLSYGGGLNILDFLGLNHLKETWKPTSPWLSMEAPQELADILKIDVKYIGLNPHPNTPSFAYGMEYYTDEWGVKYKRIEHNTGFHYDYVNAILADATVDDLETYPFPEPDNSMIEGLQERAELLFRNTDYALVGKFSNSIFEQSFYMRGFEKMLMDLVLDPAFVDALVGKMVDIACNRLELGFQACGKYIQALRLAGDDLGYQKDLLMSPSVFRKRLKPHFLRLYQKARELIDQYNPSIKLITHTDGNVRKIIPDLIEMGLDVLNPVQPLAAEMNHAELKAEYGDRLAYHAGIDIQEVLPFGTTEDVIKEVRRAIRELGPGGGFILAPTHYIQPDVPPENVMAMRDAILEYGDYPLIDGL